MSTARLAVVSEGEQDAAMAEAEAEVVRARQALPPRDEAMFDCYLGGLTHNLAAHTEADPVAIMATLLCSAGVYLGRGPHVCAADDRHPTLVWPLIVGRTSAGRKGASWSTARRLLRAADPDFYTSNIRAGLTSGEGLAEMFTTTNPNSHDTDETAGSPRPGGLPAGDSRLLVTETEWAAVMARMRREGNTLSATLRGAWEGGDLSTMGVNARIAPSSHVGILAHITPGEFHTKVSGSDMAGGTYNRFLPVYVARSQFLPLAAGIDQHTLDQLAASLHDRLQAGTQTGPVEFTGTGGRLWRRLYVEFGSDHGDHGPVEQFISRAAPNCLRIAAIHAILDQQTKIGPEHLTAAAALVRYSIDTARAIFTDTETPRRLAAWIAEADQQGRTREQVRSEYFNRNKTAAEIRTLLDQLVDAGYITVSKQPPASGKGRPTELFTATQPERG